MTSQYRLVMRSGPGAGKNFELITDEIFIGRDLNNDIVINDPEVSRRHARLFLQGASYVIEDLGSTNGTLVNGQRLMGPYTLRPGELIMFGENISLLFELAFADANATIASAPKGQPSTLRGSTPGFDAFPSPLTPSVSTPTPTPPPPYAGQIPASPAIEEPKKRKFPVWLLLLGILLIVGCSCAAFLIFVDYSNAWCDWFGWLFNMFSPGLCP